MLQVLDKQYICPGEIHPISRAVHLSRLAAFYPACRECPFRTDVGQLPKQAVQRLQQTERRVERKSLFTREGVRGVWLNELNRVRAGEIATAFAAALWEASPTAARSEDPLSGQRPMRPAVVVGYDERPSAPDIVTGVASALRRMGCQVIDIGLTTKPCHWFAVDHLQAAGGVFVTGAGCDPSWTGLDFVGGRSTPLSMRSACGRERSKLTDAGDAPEFDPIDLAEIERRLDQPSSRPTRQAGPHRTFAASVPYEAGFWKHFHALRPLHVVCGSASRLVQRTLDRLFAALPCRLSTIDLPDRARRLDDPHDADVVRVSAAVGSRRADLGVLIDEDGQHCAFVDDRSRLVPAATMTRLLAGLVLSEHARGAVVLEGNDPDVITATARFEARTIVTSSTLADVASAMQHHNAVFAGGPSGRYWFHETFPTCDAILTLAKVLDLLSRSDLDFADVAG